MANSPPSGSDSMIAARAEIPACQPEFATPAGLRPLGFGAAAFTRFAIRDARGDHPFERIRHVTIR
jgi:hypothetical protein